MANMTTRFKEMILSNSFSKNGLKLKYPIEFFVSYNISKMIKQPRFIKVFRDSVYICRLINLSWQLTKLRCKAKMDESRSNNKTKVVNKKSKMWQLLLIRPKIKYWDLNNMTGYVTDHIIIILHIMKGKFILLESSYN